MLEVRQISETVVLLVCGNAKKPAVAATPNVQLTLANADTERGVVERGGGGGSMMVVNR
jgi:hypothetical protein